jgi:drug/metabolite transporter (DMT)-like permease
VAAIALALSASLAWGVSDFLAGSQSRRVPVLTVLLLSQVLGLAFALPVALAFGGVLPGTEAMLWALGAGLAEVAAFAALYRGLATGAMSLIAPLSATAGLVPLLVGLVSGDLLGPVQWAGVALALAGVALAATESGGHAGRRVAQGCGLALLAALGFGAYFVGMDQAADGGALWAAVLSRWASLAVLVAAACALRRTPAAPAGSRVPILFVGVLDIGANALFAAALTHGLAGVVSVLGSLYPVTTVVLAQLLLHERLARAQRLGVGTALAGVALLSLATP